MKHQSTRPTARCWRAAQLVGVLSALGLVVTLFVAPDAGLFALWHIIIPVAPLLFFVAPGLWRNLCPFATLNMLPTWIHPPSQQRAPKWLCEHGYAIGITLFYTLVTLRKVLLNHNGLALAVVIIVLATISFTMGLRFQNKSGMCNALCPIMPVEHVYSQTPFLTLACSHCTPAAVAPAYATINNQKRPTSSGCEGEMSGLCSSRSYSWVPYPAMLGRSFCCQTKPMRRSSRRCRSMVGWLLPRPLAPGSSRCSTSCRACTRAT